MVDAWQRGVIAWWVHLSFQGAGLGVDAEGVALFILHWQIVAGFRVALRQLLTEHRLLGALLLDFLGASSSRFGERGNGRVNARQRGVVAWWIYFSFQGAGLGVDAEGVTLSILYWQIVAGFRVALRQLLAEQRLFAALFFDFLGASSSRFGDGANGWVNAGQRGVVAWSVHLSFDSAGLGVDAEGVTLSVLYWQVVAIFRVALRQLLAEQRLLATLLLDFLEASSSAGRHHHGVHQHGGALNA